MKISRRAVTLAGVSLLAERSIGSVARADVVNQDTVLSAALTPTFTVIRWRS